MNNLRTNLEPAGPAGTIHVSNLLTYAALLSPRKGPSRMRSRKPAGVSPGGKNYLRRKKVGFFRGKLGGMVPKGGLKSLLPFSAFTEQF